jgi:hypothetical protein
VNPEEYDAYMEHLARGKALVDDWDELRELGASAEKYC